MKQPGERKQRTFIKLAFGLLLGLLFFALLCWGSYRAYSYLESQRLARRAAAYVSGGELREAALSAMRASELDVSNVAAMRVLAEVAERANDKTAIGWRRKIVKLQPDSIEDALALANCQLQFRDLAAAEKIVSQIADKAGQTAEFHATAARLAEAKKQPSRAESHWAEAVQLAPANTSYQLQFGLALLRIDDPAKRTTALSMLEQLRGDEKERGAATRALIVDGIAHRANGQRMAALARELEAYPEAVFSDRLLYLDLLRQLRDPSFTQQLTNLEKDTTADASNLAALLSWMNANGMSLVAIDFARTVPADLVMKWPAPLTIAEAYGKLADWDKLERLLNDKDWGEFEFLRHAYLSRARREQGRPVAADREWSLAQKAAGRKSQFVLLLARAVSDWGWDKESLDLLWMLSRHPETQWEALQTLYETYALAGDSPGLYRVLSRLSELAPEDQRIQNNFAQLRLLLNADLERARKVAADVYAREPSNPAYASTYAFSLYTKGDAGAALKVMTGFNENQLRDPSLAAYYGVVLAAAGENEKAKKYLGLAASGKLLPEEKALIAKAEDTLK